MSEYLSQKPSSAWQGQALGHIVPKNAKFVVGDLSPTKYLRQIRK
ncbi:MAG: hypothetical protein ABFS56_10370 [Pseudomonadota bacterium]